MRDAALQVVQRLQEAGHTALWVGGCVRDLLLGRAPRDFDVATSARPEEVERLFLRTVPVGRQFGVVVVVEAAQQVQVATFRSESDYQDGRRPGRVEYSDAEADARRRDFTINGLFHDPLTGRTFDWVGGQSDLKAGLIRCIGEADARFGEDHLRLLRAIRLAAELGFTVESVTMRAIQRRAADLARISQERVRDELIKLLRPPHAARGLRLLRESGLLPVVLPEVEACVDCRQSPEHHPEGSVWNHVVRMLELAPADGASLLPWAILLHDIGKPQTAIVDSAGGRRRFPGHERVGADLARAILERLRFPRREIDVITTCVQCHMQFMEVARMRPSTLRRILLRPTFALELELHRLDCLGSDGRLGTYQRWRDELDALATGPQLGPPLVAGSDLLALGYVSGPRLGRDLARLRDMQLQGRIHTRGEGLAVARVWLAGPVSPENSGTGDP